MDATRASPRRAVEPSKVIRAVTRKGIAEGHEVVGLWRGYAGLAERSYVPLDIRAVSGILPLAISDLAAGIRFDVDAGL